MEPNSVLCQTYLLQKHDIMSGWCVLNPASRGCYDNLNDVVSVSRWLQRVGMGRGSCGGTVPFQTRGTQDKRSQSKGDVEVMKTKALRGRELLEAVVKLSTSNLLSPSCTARRISWPRLYGNLAPHGNAKLSLIMKISPPSVTKWKRII